MSDHLFKTPRNPSKDSAINLGTKEISSVGSHLPADTLTPPQDADLRRSARNVGKDSIVKKIKQSSQKMYPGSGTKPHLRRSFRTPIQTIPLRIIDGKTEHSASKSFAVMPDEEDMVTPRSAVEGLMATADSQRQTFKATPKVSQVAVAGTTVMTKIFKTPEQADRVMPQRIYSMTADIASPGSTFTPRENIWSLLHCVQDQTQTPVKITHDQSGHMSTKSGVSTMKLSEWGQEVTVSPLYLSQTSDEREDSPSFSMKFMKRSRRSFHIKDPLPKVKASQGTSQQILLEKGQKKVQSDDVGSANENLECTSAAVLSEKLDTNVVSDIFSSAAPSADDIPDVPAGTGEAVATAADINTTYISVKETNLWAEEELNEGAETDILMTVAENVNIVRQNSLGVSRSSRSEMAVTVLEDIVDDKYKGEHIRSITQEQIDHGDVEDEFVNDGGILGADMAMENLENNIVNELGEGNIEADKEYQDEGGRDKNVDSAIFETVYELQKDKAVGSPTQVGEEELINDMDVQNREMENDLELQNNDNNNITSALGLENVREAASVGPEELRKENNLLGSRTSFTSKHGEISFSASPKKSPKSAQVAVPPLSDSIYNLSEESSSSGDIHFSKPRSSSMSPRKGSTSKSPRKGGQSGSASTPRNKTASNRGITATETFRQGTGSSQKRSKLSYSEWKSLQKGKDVADQTVSSFNMHPQRSSTPANRTKKILHSTRIQNSVFAHTSHDQMSDAFTVDQISDISPIRPDLKSQGQKGSRRETVHMDADEDSYDSAGNQNQFSITRKRKGAELEMESTDDDSLGFSPLATPYIDMDKRTRVTSAGQKSVQKQRVQKGISGSGQNKDMAEATGHPTKRRKTVTSSTALPRRSVKFFAERHSTMKLSKDAVEEIEKASEVFWDNTFKALEAYALHAGRKIINEQDAILLMETQRLIKDKEDLHDKIRQYLPMELRSELIPMAKP